MLFYSFRGSSLSGSPLRGVRIGVSREAVLMRLASQGIQCDSLKPVHEEIRRVMLGPADQKKVTAFLRQLADLLGGRILFLPAWQLARAQLNPGPLRDTITEIEREVESGSPVWHACERHPWYFDLYCVQMMKAGERSGNLTAAIDKVTAFREERQELFRKLRAALWYPATVLIIAVAVTFLLLTLLVPIFEGLYSSLGIELPAHTRMLVSASAWLQRNTVWAVLACCITAICGFLLVRTAFIRRQIDRWSLQLPVLGTLARAHNSARFAHTLGSLLEAGVSLPDAYSMAAQSTGSMVLAAQLSNKLPEVEAGKSLGSVLQEVKVLPSVLSHFVSVGENTGRLSSMLIRIASIQEKEARQQLEQLTRLVEPIIVIVIGAVVAAVLLSIYLPMFELTHI